MSRQFLLHDRTANQGRRFIVAGALASSINWCTRFAASWIMPFPVALIVSAIVGMSVGFILYFSWVFPKSIRPLHVQIGLFLLVNAVTAGFVIGVSLLLAELIKDVPMSIAVQEGIAHAIGIGFGAGANFVGHRFITFGRHKSKRVRLS